MEESDKEKEIDRLNGCIEKLANELGDLTWENLLLKDEMQQSKNAVVRIMELSMSTPVYCVSTPTYNEGTPTFSGRTPTITAELLPLTDPDFMQGLKNPKDFDKLFVDFYRSFKDFNVNEFDVITHFNVQGAIKTILSDRSVKCKELLKLCSQNQGMQMKLERHQMHQNGMMQQNNRHQALEAKMQKLVAELEAVKKENQSIVQSREDLQTELDNAEARLQNANKQNQKSMMDSNREIFNKSQEISNLGATCQKMKAELEAAKKSYQSIESKLHEASRQATQKSLDSSNELQQKDCQIDQLKTSNQSLIAEVAEMKLKLEAVNQNKINLRKLMETAQSQSTLMKKQQAEKKAGLEKLLLETKEKEEQERREADSAREKEEQGRCEADSARKNTEQELLQKVQRLEEELEIKSRNLEDANARLMDREKKNQVHFKRAQLSALFVEDTLNDESTSSEASPSPLPRKMARRSVPTQQTPHAGHQHRNYVQAAHPQRHYLPPAQYLQHRLPAPMEQYYTYGYPGQIPIQPHIQNIVYGNQHQQVNVQNTFSTLTPEQQKQYLMSFNSAAPRMA